MTLLQDLRVGFRILRRSRGTSLIAVITLALGIGGSTAMFTLLDAVVLRPLPYPAPERLVDVTLASTDPELDNSVLGTADYFAIRDGARSFEAVAAYTRATIGYAVSGLGGEPERVPGAAVTADFFRVLGVTPAIGAGFSKGADAADAPLEVVVSDGFWRRRLGADPGALGRTLMIEGKPHTIVAVMPRDLRVPMLGGDIWRGLRLRAPDARPPYYLSCIARLAPGVSMTQAREDLSRVVAGVEKIYPGTFYVAGHVKDLKETIVGGSRAVIGILLAAVALLLLVAAVNVANLQLARGAARERELAIRASLGASRGRIARELLIESLLLSVAGGVAGVLLAMWGGEARAALAPSLPRAAEVHVDARVAAFAAALSIGVGILFGLAPAILGSRQDLGDTLRRTGPAAGGGRIRRALVVAEVALTVALLVGAGLLARSLDRLGSVDSGVDARNVVTMHLSLPEGRYPQGTDITKFYDTLLQRIEALPGVEAAGIGMSLPPNLGQMRNPYSVEGRPPSGPAPLAQELVISPGYLRALGVPLEHGRWFDGRDAGKAPLTLLVNRTLARRTFGDEDPVGKRLITGDPSPDSPRETIVGVVGDVRYDGLDAEPEPTLYAPYSVAWWPDFSRGMYLVVRSPQPAAAVIAGVRQTIASLDPELPVGRIRTLRQVTAESMAPQRFRTGLMILFAAAAVLLAMVGMYGVLAHAVTQKTVEIGVRMALGARARQVLLLVVAQGLRLALAGVAIGLVAAFALSRWIASLLYGVTPTDVPSYLFAAAAALLMAVLAVALPARRASRVDPMVAMRGE